MNFRSILITGGAGFIGTNAVEHYLKKGKRVILLDNFSRKGSRENLRWLKGLKSRALDILEADVSSSGVVLDKAVEHADVVLHLAGQVAVTTSVADPELDFRSNMVGTFNLLEAIRTSKSRPLLLYSSTNKVYGRLETLKTKETDTRYSFTGVVRGVSEHQPLDFFSPYGCSKGAADQYVRDYARVYGLKTVVLRQSCIYGPHQMGIEDQGWVAWFMIAALKRKPITIYGSGKQVRDVLHVKDLLMLYDKVLQRSATASGKIYNIGGGPTNTISIWKEFGPILEKLTNKKIHATFAPERLGDQPLYISDISKAKRELGWTPKIRISKGFADLFAWISTNV